MAAGTVLVQHPTLPDVVKEVPTESVKDWTASGWVRVKREDEAKVRAQHFLPPSSE
jgi:hypothetical protein